MDSFLEELSYFCEGMLGVFICLNWLTDLGSIFAVFRYRAFRESVSLVRVWGKTQVSWGMEKWVHRVKFWTGDFSFASLIDSA